MQMSSWLESGATVSANQNGQKVCVTCGAPAELTLCGLLSTIGITPRQQKAAKTVPFCLSCLHGLCRDSEQVMPSQLREHLGAALTALARAPAKEVEATRALPAPG